LKTHSLFPTVVYEARLPVAQRRALDERLLREALQLRKDDVAGRAWSRDNYRGGYTSYGSLCRLQTISPTFARLEKQLDAHVRRYARVLDFDLRGRKLTMTDCWVNLMSRGVAHGLHLHPQSVISGTYYVRVPDGSAALKFEDPRLDRFMAAPPRHARHGVGRQTWVSSPAAEGKLVMFESWLRHEVPAQPVNALRVSVSFNYGWF
jgi:uncharacterized protein (TIGR02466 family)